MANAVSKEVKYLNRDFSSFRSGLMEFAKTYFPNTYNDFNESDPGMMFIEMASYVGDVLSYYIDEQFKESMLAFAEEKKTIYEIAQGYGYKPRQASPASVELDVFQTVPASSTIVSSDGLQQPNEDYCLTIPAGMNVTSTNGTIFRTLDDVIFRDSSSLSTRQEDIYEVDNNSNVSKWLLKKEKVKAVSGTITTEYINFGAAEKYKRVALQNSPVLEIISVTDSDGNKWYEVPFLAQDTVYADFENTSKNSPDLVSGRNFAPFLLKLVKTSKRFTIFIRTDGRIEMRFGSGVAAGADEEIIPNPSNVGSNLPGTPSFLDSSFDPANFLNTETYGQCPTNTTLTIKYSYGGGVQDNVASNAITSVSKINSEFDNSLTLNTNLKTTTQNSVAVTNPQPATGGSGAETLENVRTNALAYFQAQSRAVTKDDYITRVYSLPPKYGNIAKVYIIQDEQVAAIDQNTGDATYQPNPLALNMYMLGYDQSKKLVNVNNAVKENVKTYLSQYRLMTDAVQIKDAWVCNIGIRFAIFTKKGNNKNEVMLNCVNKLKVYFHAEKWQINQPIILADVVSELLSVEGVASVVKSQPGRDELIIVTNKWGSAKGYSNNLYDIQSATHNGVIYPSVDPAIFELKYPDTDIQGRVLGDI
jgi:ribosomal protein L21